MSILIYCKTIILKICRLYNVFGSGASHGIYAQFIAQSVTANNGRAIGLLRGSDTRMALCFYAMHRALRLKSDLLATIHQPKFTDLQLNDRCRLAVQDIENKGFWKAIYFLLRSVFPPLRVLRYCDSNTPAMDKICFLSHRSTEAIQNSVEYLNDETIFGSIKDDGGVTFEKAQIFESGEGGGNENKGDMYCGSDG